MSKGGNSMCNKELREYAKIHGVKLWQIAEMFGLSDVVFSKKLRHELSIEDATKFKEFTDEIANGGEKHA